MADTMTIRISRLAYEQLERLSLDGDETIAATVERAIRLLQQEVSARGLAAPLTDEEIAWLDSDAD